MGSAGVLKVTARLGQRHIKAGFTRFDPSEDILKGNRCLPGSGISLEEVKPFPEQSTLQNVIEAGHS
jgi:hypothetical protein